VKKETFEVGEVIRYDDGSSALMRIDHVSPIHGTEDRYYGEQCMGGSVGCYISDARKITPEDLEVWDKYAHYRLTPEQTFIKASKDVLEEVYKAASKWPPMNSAHEAYAVLAEEVDELWDHVKTNQSKRDLQAMRKEAIQVAAMALRFAVEVCNEKVGRK